MFQTDIHQRRAPKDCQEASKSSLKPVEGKAHHYKYIDLRHRRMETPAEPSGLVLFDIAFAQPRGDNSAAPNPWKARYALNFKGVAYSTRWIQMPDIPTVRRKMGVPACRKFADGSDFYTLPILTDSKTGATIGDSFDIANYLQDTFPNAGAGDLFPSLKLGYVCPGEKTSMVPLSERKDDIHAEYAQFNNQVDLVFSLHAGLVTQGMEKLWDPTSVDTIKADILRRAGIPSWDVLELSVEARTGLLTSLRDDTQGLAVLFQKDTKGPFILGGQPSFADIIVGGWLRMLSKALPESEWEEIQTWHDGAFGKLHAALQEQFGDVK